MDILVSCNDQYIMPTMVMLTSFFSSNSCENKKGERHTVYMLESRLSDVGNARLSGLAERFDADYIRLHLKEDAFAGAKTRPHISVETYYRLLASKDLPDTLERILWLDSDLIVRGDIGMFYRQPLEGVMAAACGYGSVMQPLIHENASKLGLKYHDTYFNAGVMLLNLKECRKSLDEELLLNLTKPEKTANYLFPGQDVVNLVFDGRIKLEDYRLYNCMIHCIGDSEDLLYAKEHALIVHFPGEAKPWRFDDIHFADEWLDWYIKCFGSMEGLRRLSYFRLKAMYERQRKLEK